MDVKEKNQVKSGLLSLYWMEMETVMNCVRNSVNPNGVRAEEVKKATDTLEKS